MSAYLEDILGFLPDPPSAAKPLPAPEKKADPPVERRRPATPASMMSQSFSRYADAAMVMGNVGKMSPPCEACIEQAAAAMRRGEVN